MEWGVGSGEWGVGSGEWGVRCEKKSVVKRLKMKNKLWQELFVSCDAVRDTGKNRKG